MWVSFGFLRFPSVSFRFLRFPSVSFGFRRFPSVSFGFLRLPLVYDCIVLPCALLCYIYMLTHCVTLCYIVLCSNTHGEQHLNHGTLRVDPGAPRFNHGAPAVQSYHGAVCGILSLWCVVFAVCLCCWRRFALLFLLLVFSACFVCRLRCLWRERSGTGLAGRMVELGSRRHGGFREPSGIVLAGRTVELWIRRHSGVGSPAELFSPAKWWSLGAGGMVESGAQWMFVGPAE